MAQAGRQPAAEVSVAQLLDRYVSTARRDVSTFGYIRRTIKPALGSTQVRKVHGPLLDTFRQGAAATGTQDWQARPRGRRLHV